MDPFERLRDGSRWMWSLGDYGDLARYLQPHAEALAAMSISGQQRASWT